MICNPCAVGGWLNSKGDPASKNSHELCKGCDCQHKTGQGWVKPVRNPNTKA